MHTIGKKNDMLSLILTILFTLLPTILYAQEAQGLDPGYTLLSWIVEYIIPISLTLFAIYILKSSFPRIGPTEVGLLNKRFSFKKLSSDNLIAFNGEAGYQARLLMPGRRFALFGLYSIQKYNWVQIPPGEIGLVVSQLGASLDQGQRTAIYKDIFGNFSDLTAFVNNGGQKGIQRRILLPGAILPLHPIAFTVISKTRFYGQQIDTDSYDSFGINRDLLKLRMIPVGKIGIVTSYEGAPLENGDIAGRLGEFKDVQALETDSTKTESDLINAILATKNVLHQNYQDAQKFLDNGGKVGLQHDPLLTGAYALNPAVFNVNEEDMLTVEQGEVAVIKSYVGLPSLDESDDNFQFGVLVKPGHRGIWKEPLGTGKYALNPQCYAPVKVPTAILTLNWSNASAEAHELDANLKQIEAKSKEGFPYAIDLEVQLHIQSSKAPVVICMVQTIPNMIDTILQAAVGNHFRDKMQSLTAVEIIEERGKMQVDAQAHIADKLNIYHIETRGVYIQDMVLPDDVTKVLQQRLIANERKDTYDAEKIAQDARLLAEKSRGMADAQVDLSKSEVAITIAGNNASSRMKNADGEAYFNNQVGKSKGAEIEAIGRAKAVAYKEQRDAIGENGVIATTVADALSKSQVPIMPTTLVAGSGFDGILGMFSKYIETNGHKPVETK